MAALDMRERPIEIGPNHDGSYCFIHPHSEPIVTQGPEGEEWYVAVLGYGTRGKARHVTGEFPVRAFATKEDAVCLMSLLSSGTVRWQDAREVPIKDGKRGLIHMIRLIG
jgi:hypothetical protein